MEREEDRVGEGLSREAHRQFLLVLVYFSNLTEINIYQFILYCVYCDGTKLFVL